MTFAKSLFTDADEALATGLRILIIIVAAILLRTLLNQAIKKLTQRSIDGKMPVMLNPLKGRAREAVVAATGLMTERRRQRAQTLRSVLRSITSVFILTVAVILILGELGINLGPIMASAGIVGVALGFGAQSLIKDYLNGISMILEDQYGVGDLVDLGEATGTIEAVGLRTTRLRDAYGVVWYVRNGEVVRVANQSQGTATIMVDMPVAHGTNLHKAQEVMSEALSTLAEQERESEAIVDEPRVLGVQTVSATGIVLRAMLSVTPSERFRIDRTAKQRIAEAFLEAGIATPPITFPPQSEGQR